MSLKNKVGKLDNIARLRVIKRPPSVSDGQNGDMLLGNISGKLILYIKYNNSWNSVPLRKGNKQSTSDNLAGFSHDTGWFAVNSPTDDRLFYDSNNITVGAGLTSSTVTTGDYKMTIFKAGTDTVSWK